MDRPVPVPDAVTAPFWEAAREHRLVIQRCEACSTYQHPPGPVCRSCGGEAVPFRDVTGRGTLYSFTTSEVALDERFESALPLIIGLVELEERGPARLLCNIGNEYLEELAVDMPMRVTFEEVGGGAVIPQFEPDV